MTAHQHHKLFCNISKALSEASTPTCGGDTFDTKELTISHRFASIGLNLAFEGLLLGVILRTIAEGTRRYPRLSGSQILNTFDYAKDMLIMFCKEPKVPVASMRRLRWISGKKACVTEQVEARMRRWCTDHQLGVPGPT
jgi:hypothetical protein